MHGDDGSINAFFFLPIVCAIWIGLSVLLILVRPSVAKRAGEKLTAEEGLSAETVATG
jgi:hypothetical protein